MDIYDIIWIALVFSFVVAMLAYIVPGMILRAIRDFKRRHGKGEADVEEP